MDNFGNRSGFISKYISEEAEPWQEKQIDPTYLRGTSVSGLLRF